ncbi:P-loop containing nucleoside triphosphate hydrolase protein [Dunaliella salina]|uniref:ATP-dependent DNA helicase n=1 Tax=Dunaliella salina TaxID=3046 RepID=A0ABQ7H7E3_DUNSA|nr:P-loop containing nucleoside triphosphate hydrolase protein [Dunaliella salina]|eukprot:KAF5842776.1 P-loop containing nucleoside triphosphate hydrolase protein [Dunaliella salina]
MNTHLCAFRYEVQKKRKSVLDDMCELISQRFVDRNTNRVQCGIVYCFSRSDCEKVARELQAAFNQQGGVRVAIRHYHANLSPEEKEAVQADWSHDRVQVIVATIAFGMGINKPDVRFVIHFSIPKSLEGYHQETGRAGRDGREAACILYYSYGDCQKMRSMIQDNQQGIQTPPEQVQCNIESLNSMVTYAEEQVECRRVQLLQHFGERFNPVDCRGTCDVCRNREAAGMDYEMQDMSVEAQKMVELVQSLNQGKTANYVLNVWHGSKNQQVLKAGHNNLPLHGYGKDRGKNTGSRLLRQLMQKDVLREETFLANGFSSSAIKVVPAKARQLERGELKVVLPVITSGGGETSKSGGKTRQPRGSTKRRGKAGSVSPVRAPALKSGMNKRVASSVDLDEIEPIDLTNDRCVAERKKKK